jgi:hypothetical protein
MPTKKKKKTIFAESTEVDPKQSAGEITTLLVEAGAQAISTNYNAAREIVSLSFSLQIGSYSLSYLLPVRIDPVFQFLQNRRAQADPVGFKRYAAPDLAKAKRIAWRQLFWWLKAQLALIEMGMVETAEVMLPYMLGADGRSFFDTYKPRLLEAKKEAGR